MASPAALSPVNDVIAFFARAPSREEIAAFRLSPSAHERLRALLARHAAGMLPSEEQRELDQMVLLGRHHSRCCAPVSRATRPPPREHGADFCGPVSCRRATAGPCAPPSRTCAPIQGSAAALRHLWYGWQWEQHLWHFDVPALTRVLAAQGLERVGVAYNALYQACCPSHSPSSPRSWPYRLALRRSLGPKRGLGVAIGSFLPPVAPIPHEQWW